MALNQADRNQLAAILEGRVSLSTESSCVQSYDYDLNTNTLTITFPGSGRGGSGTWEYQDFPIEEFLLFAQSSSLGTYFNTYIRDRYSYSRVA